MRDALVGEVEMPSEQASDPKSPPRFLFVDGLRGVAALWVVFFHLYEGGHISSLAEVLPDLVVTPLFRWGNSGVPIFFALSGFVIAHSLRAPQFRSADALRFMVRRSIRLDPPYYASIAFVLFMGILSSRVAGGAFEMPGGGRLLAHLFYLQDLLGYEPISDVYWTLCYEMQFYLVSCPLLVWAAGSGRRDRVLLLAALVALPWGTGLVTSNLHPGLFINLWYAFLAGQLCYHATTGRIRPVWFLAFAWTILLSGAWRGDRFAVVSSATALVLSLAMRRDRMSRWLSGRAVQFLGAISYSLYLTHNQVTGATAFVLRRLLGSSPMTESAMTPVILIACLAVAYVMWRLVERPFQRLSRVFGRRQASPVYSAAPGVTPASPRPVLPWQ